MSLPPFIGRSRELEQLNLLYRKAIPSLAVVKGRRRIGKSRLIAEFAAQHGKGRFWHFAGLAPEGKVDAQMQRDHFARQLATQLAVPPMTFHDWADALNHLSAHIQAGDIILFDEISWMGANDATFIPKLKHWWDQQTCAVTLFFCGSVSTWIEDNILNSTAFFGRVNLTISLEPLSIPDSALLLQALQFQGSNYDKYQLLAVFGGVPWYLEQAGPGVTADAMIQQLCFEKDGLLVLEFDRIFHDLFNGKGVTYKKILGVLRDGMKTLSEIRQAVNFAHSGTLSQLLGHLITAGFVQKQTLWSFKTAKPLRQSLYRICDPYLRFYLKVIEGNRAKIDAGLLNGRTLSQLPGFESHMGLQLEYLLLQNRPLLLQSMGIAAADVVCDGPYRQVKTTKFPGCQIDYLVQTRTNTLFVCEFKFKQRELGVDIIDSMQQKINALALPRGFAAVPVLFHSGGVSATVDTAEYFYRIIDIADFLNA